MPSNPFGETPLNKDEKEKIERLDSIIRECKELGFSFGKENNSIHAQQGRTFLKKFCKTDTALMECLKNGYTPNLRWRVPRYEEPNNNSAKAEMPFVRAKVAEWEQKGRAGLLVADVSHAFRFAPTGSGREPIGGRYGGHIGRQDALSCSHYLRRHGRSGGRVSVGGGHSAIYSQYECR